MAITDMAIADMTTKTNAKREREMATMTMTTATMTMTTATMTTATTTTATTATASTPVAPTSTPTPGAGTVLDLLERSRSGLLLACHSTTAAERYTQAHLSALRAGAALLAARSTPSRRSRPRSVWELLPTVAPELTEWAIFFAESGRRRLVLERGQSRGEVPVVSARDADDLVRAGERFLELVRQCLHLPCGQPLPAELTPVAARS